MIATKSIVVLRPGTRVRLTAQQDIYAGARVLALTQQQGVGLDLPMDE